MLSQRQIDPEAMKSGMTGLYCGAYFRIAHATNRGFSNRLEALSKPHARLFAQISDLAASNDPKQQAEGERLRELQQRLVKRAASEHILKGWGRDPDFNDPTIDIDEERRDVAFSPEVAFELFCDPQNLDFWRFVDQCSADTEAWIAYTRELRGKGSSAGTSGSATGPEPGQSKTKKT